jgi:hypothetical protein
VDDYVHHLRSGCAIVDQARVDQAGNGRLEDEGIGDAAGLDRVGCTIKRGHVWRNQQPAGEPQPRLVVCHAAETRQPAQRQLDSRRTAAQAQVVHLPAEHRPQRRRIDQLQQRALGVETRNHRWCADPLAVGQDDSGHLPSPDGEVGDLGARADFSATGLRGASQGVGQRPRPAPGDDHLAG